MMRGIKALAVLAAVVAASAAPQIFAACNSAEETYAIFQCADRAYFAPPPAGSGAVSGVFWNIGFGNRSINTGSGADGTSFASKAFNGNDNGNFPVNILDGATSFPTENFPPGSLCLGSNNWANAGVDGCNDNPRDGLLAFTNDNMLNPLFDVQAFNNSMPGVPSTLWAQDGPMAVLLTEGTGRFFAMAAVSNMPRADELDTRQGFYQLSEVSNGGVNAMTGRNNVVPWQRVPGDGEPLVRAVDPNSVPREVDLGWRGVVLHSDGSSVPSSNSVVIAIGLTGMGTAEHSLVRYVLEENDIDDPNNPVGGLNPMGWTTHTPASGPTGPDPNGNFTAHAVVPLDTCLRLHTYFGVAPQESMTYNQSNCRQGICGDTGYEVVSPPSCIGGALAADGVPRNASAVRGKGGVDVSFETSTELSVVDFKIYALTQSAGRLEVARLTCRECSTGSGAKYMARIPMGQLKGARELEIEASTGASAKVMIK